MGCVNKCLLSLSLLLFHAYYDGHGQKPLSLIQGADETRAAGTSRWPVKTSVWWNEMREHYECRKGQGCVKHNPLKTGRV